MYYMCSYVCFWIPVFPTANRRLFYDTRHYIDGTGPIIFVSDTRSISAQIRITVG